MCGSPSPMAPQPSAAECRSGRAGDHLRARARAPSSEATSGRTAPIIEPVCDQRRQLGGVEPELADEPRVVLEPVEVPVVGQPGAAHRGVGGRRPAGESHRQVVDRLQVPARGRGDLGLVALEVEHVADRVAAERRRDAAGVADPGRERARRVAHQRAADHARASTALRACRATSRRARPAPLPRPPGSCSPTGPCRRRPRPDRPGSPVSTDPRQLAHRSHQAEASWTAPPPGSRSVS